MSEQTSPARAALDALQGHEAWAVIRRSTRAGDRDTVGLVGGSRSVVESILDVPLDDGEPEAGHIADRLLAVPFRQVRERGFEAHDDGTPLVVVDVETEQEFTVAEIVDAIDDVAGRVRRPRRLRDRRRGVRRARRADHRRRDRPGRGRQPGDRPALPRDRSPTGAHARALTVLQAAARARARRLLDLLLLHRRPLPDRRQPRSGTSAIHDGDVRMNPISRHLPDPARAATSRAAPVSFLRDEKEIYELFMVVDEELKMMCDICHEGGQVLGPFLKPMTPPRAHGVPPRRSHRPRPARDPARHDVRRHGHRQPGRERLPADHEVRARGPRLLRRRAGDPRPRRGRRADRRQPDRDPHRRRRRSTAGSR